ncbi:UNVERIFIED_CONTAM: Phosphoserine aminotransferase 2, chloroplastic [Sesamum radiatum]|uniref:Phosphoserine aminotransferase 2, chloroplastic n=1 Tax=Sesamum radiatum TaxID=300843 RepID=A0AAW2V7F6_SESRA
MTTVAMSSAAADTAFRHLKAAASISTTAQVGAFPSNLSLPSNCAARKAVSITCSSTTLQTPSAATAASSSSDRVFNFAAGPATLPENVLLKAQSELYNWNGCGMSVMEMSHRGKEFLSIIQKAESDLRTLLNIPSNYSVLFLQGGATTQFAAVPLNLCSPDDVVDYVVTGSWGDKAFKEAAKYCKPKTIWSGKSEKYTKIPTFDALEQTWRQVFAYLRQFTELNSRITGR